MAGEQGELPLGKENTIPDKGARQSLPDVLKTLDKARKTVDLLVKAKDTSRAEGFQPWTRQSPHFRRSNSSGRCPS